MNLPSIFVTVARLLCIWGGFHLLFFTLSDQTCKVAAQTIPISPKTIKDSKGKDFWMAFPRNHHDGGGGNFDRLYIHIVSERATQGLIEMTLRDGQVQKIPFSLAENSVYTYDTPYFSLELDGPGIQNTTIHITANEEVTVYGLSIATTTSDAFLAFPTDVLGKDYVIASYPSNLLQTGGRINTNTSTMSQFTIIAPYDSTVVTITPTVKTWYGDSTTYSIVLNKGQGYLVSLYPTEENRLRDFTGSRIVSTKPIVVYGGHERAAIPAGQGGSRDFLIEQMLPVEVWGKTAIVVPYPMPSGNTRPDLGCDLVRVIAGYNNTVVSINGTRTALLKAGEYYETVIAGESSITTSEPAIVAGYKCSARGGQGAIGDPFLAVIPPVEQFLTRYRFVCVQGTQTANNQFNRTEPAFVEHYVTVIVPSTKASTVVLNGGGISMQAFKAIPGTEYSYAIIPLAEGTHSIAADTSFGITVAGYGRANSYGYIGGQRFEADIRAPEIVTARSCTGIVGAAFDSSASDSKIFFYDTLRTAQENIRFRFGNLPTPADSLTFAADLLNPFEDGRLGLIVVDSLDLRTAHRVLVPGFTLHPDPAIRTNAVIQAPKNGLRLATGKEYCFRLNVSNYGATSQTIERISFARGLPEFQVGQPQNLRIEPSSQGAIEYCFRSDNDGVFIDTLIISNGCQERQILALFIETGTDRLPPTLTRQTDDCNHTVVLETSDNRPFDAGIQNIQTNIHNMIIREEVVGAAASVPDSTKRSRRLVLSVINPRLDAIYAVLVRDSVGNETFLRDTIQGYTLRVVASSNADTSVGALALYEAYLNGEPQPFIGEYRFRAINATSMTCASLTLRNDGVLPFVVDKATFGRNIQIALPPSQFPIAIAPGGGTGLLKVCFQPNLVTTYSDTLTLEKYCIAENILFRGEGVLGTSIAGTRCDAVIRLSSLISGPNAAMSASAFHNGGNIGTGGQKALASLVQVQHFPDPASDVINLRIGLTSERIVNIRLLSMIGTEVASLPSQRLGTGEWEYAVQLHHLETGTYCCEILATDTNASETKFQRWTGLIRIVR